MKQRILIWSLVLFFIWLLPACGRKPVTYSKNSIMVCDNIDDELITAMEGIKEDIEQSLPDSCIRLNIWVYSATTQNDSDVFSVSLGSDSKEDRGKDFKMFIEELKKHKKASVPFKTEKSAIRCISNIVYKHLQDSNTRCDILMHTDMIEYAGGGQDTDPNINIGWKNGFFRFADERGQCLPAELVEAKRQLDDSNSFIYNNIIKNAILSKERCHTHVYFISKTPPLFDDKGCNRVDIKAFWDSLFNAMGIICRDNISLSDCPLFK